ncbi:uncharacterized protein LOC120314267 isoform X2 [Crotalus tigris]|uniref:uncharacterized protein LOC120314267 isoform X2 n=1 Tax=Crotalus tigris TaxID=88082 RepID=UPI00192FA311|nr:uncharacterized protein LOC120314267 isoform X2 [Crotalus tigris]
MKSSLFLIPAAVVAVTLAGTAVWALQDNRRGMKVNPLKNSHGSKRVKLTCNSCDGQLEAQTQDSSTIVWTLNGKKASNHISVDLRITITVQDSPQNYGLWQCSNPRCRTQFDGYCLEDEFRISERLESEETPWSTPAPLDTKKKFKILVIGGCVIGFITLLWMGVAIFVLWEKLQSRRISPSKTAKEPKSQGIQNSLGVEKPLKDQGKEKDVEMNEEAEEIQYSVLEFKETEQCQSRKKEGIPATIYAEMLASNCSES